MKKKLILIGDSLFSQIAYEYFTFDSDYEVICFSVEKKYKTKESLFGLPIVDFETVQEKYPPSDYSAFVAIPYTQFNRLRKRLYEASKEKGYKMASYISSRAFVWRNVKLGEHCFIFEDNTVQPFVEIGNNVVLWSGNHIGHHSKIRDHVFIASHAVVSGNCDIGESCFLGVNCTIINDLKIARDTLIGAGALITKPTEAGVMMKGSPSQVGKSSSYEHFSVPADLTH